MSTSHSIFIRLHDALNKTTTPLPHITHVQLSVQPACFSRVTPG